MALREAGRGGPEEEPAPPFLFSAPDSRRAGKSGRGAGRRPGRYRRIEETLGLVSENPRTDAILAMIEPSLADLGYEVVRVHFGGGDRPVLQIMIERADGEEVNVDDCAAASRAVSLLLDVSDPISEAYHLEVSSPGIDRPLTRPKDFESFAGHEARVELKHAVEGRRRFHGRLLGLDGDNVRLAADAAEGTDEIALPLGDIAKAKLVLTDELIAASLQGRSNQR